MGLYIVGQNIDSGTAHYRTQRGYLQQVMRGIYIDKNDSDNIILQHAARIANYLYKNTYLTGPSAMLIGPTPDGRLFLASRRRARKRIRALEIIQVDAPQNPSVTSISVTDSLGDFGIDISSSRQRILEAFQPRSEVASAMTEQMRQELIDRLIAEYGGGPSAVDAVWALARETGMYKEAEQAEKALLREKPLHVVLEEQGVDLYVAWHKVPLGRLRHNGYEWRWTHEKVELPPAVRDSVPGKLPPLISSLLPEGWLEQVLNERDERGVLLSGRRYMSNISIVTELSALGSIPEDVIVGRLADWSADGVFRGDYRGPGRESLSEGFERILAQAYEDVDTPRLSGVQIKAPMYLDAKGVLTIASGKPFTHLLKPSGAAGFEDLPVIEWATMTLASRIYFETPTIALIEMPDDLPPALIVERFDIRSQIKDKTFYCLEDFCSLSGVSSEAKYHSTIERVARDLGPVSSDPDSDLLILLKRAAFAWLVADGDMHLKNLALLKTAHSGSRVFDKVRFAPAYDAVCTRVFQPLANDRMALKLNGKDDRLRKSDFMTAARTIGLAAGVAEDALDLLADRLNRAADDLQLPTLKKGFSERTVASVRKLKEIIAARLEAF